MTALDRRVRGHYSAGAAIATFIALIALSLFAAAPLAAQEPGDTMPAPAPPDTLPRDTIPREPPSDPLPPDTLPGDTARDDLLRVPVPPEGMVSDTLPDDSLLQVAETSVVRPFPEFPDPARRGWGVSRWEWDREDLLHHHGLSLLAFVDRVPGVSVTRTGAFGRPAAVSLFGWGGARVRLFVDGYEIDPFVSDTPDLQDFALHEMERVVIERTPTELRIELTSYRLRDPDPVAQVEIGTGNDGLNLLRGSFTRAFGSRHIVTAGGSLTTIDGIGIEEPYKVSGGRLAWTYAITSDAALRFEYRVSSAEREQPEFFATDYRRNDAILRARGTVLPGLVLDGMIGHSKRDPRDADSLSVEASALQGAVRGAFESRYGWLEGSARLRSGQDAVLQPESDLGVRALLSPLPGLSVEAGARSMSVAGDAHTEISAVGRIGLPAGFSAFAGLAAGSRPAALVRDSIAQVITGFELNTTGGVVRVDTITEPVREFEFRRISSEADGLRFGGEWRGWGARLGLAALRMQEGEIAPLSAIGDSVGVTRVDAASGMEAVWDLPVPRLDGLRLTGSYIRWSGLAGRPYLPRESIRAAAEFHDVFIDGQFEPSFRAELERRGETLVPGLSDEGAPIYGTIVEPYSIVNLSLQIRILDLRAFAILENVFNTIAADVPLGDPLFPGAVRRGPVAVYGVRWEFRN